jgi:hypothetical protein
MMRQSAIFYKSLCHQHRPTLGIHFISSGMDNFMYNPNFRTSRGHWNDNQKQGLHNNGDWNAEFSNSNSRKRRIKEVFDPSTLKNRRPIRPEIIAHSQKNNKKKQPMSMNVKPSTLFTRAININGIAKLMVIQI